MNFIAWFKSKTADKVLFPVRNQIIELIESDSNVLEVGCGTGDLLFRMSNNIEYGLGVDLDPRMIDFAKNKIAKENVNNLAFIERDIQSLNNSLLSKFNISTSTLCFHEMSEKDAISSLSLLGNHTQKIIIADYAAPNTFWGKVSIEIDELISGHYNRFRHYRNKGRIPYLAKKAGLGIRAEIGTSIDGILIWILDGKNANGKAH